MGVLVRRLVGTGGGLVGGVTGSGVSCLGRFSSIEVIVVASSWMLSGNTYGRLAMGHFPMSVRSIQSTSSNSRFDPLSPVKGWIQISERAFIMFITISWSLHVSL